MRRLGLLVAVLTVLPAYPAGAAGPRPDLTLRTVAAPPAQLAAGARLTLTAKVRNGGKRKAKATRVGLYLSKDARRDRSDTRLASAKLKALKPRKQASKRVAFTVPATPEGTYRFVACADDAKKVKERSERNNCRASSAFAVVPGLPGATPTPTPSPGPSPAPTPGPTDTPSPQPSSSPSPQPSASPSPSPTATPPAVDPDAPQDLIDTVGFLIDDQGAAAGAIDARRVAVLRGRVVDATGQPLAGVTVSALGHDELGETATGADGTYSLVINGGGASVVDFAKPGLLPAQRRITTPWRDYVVLDDVALIALDPASTEIDTTAGDAFQVARGTPQTDGDGSRRATLLFPEGLTATMHLPDGSTQPISDLTVRATEYTSTGLEAMPGTLPPTNGYTYAAEFSIDEAIAAGATGVSFDQPVPNYTENFVDAPVGATVPTASYNRARGRWIPQPNGRVIKVLSETGGSADLDVDGDGTADAGTALGITAAERTAVAGLYTPGDELLRVPLSHFSPWDHNFPYGPPSGAQSPNLDDGGDPEPPADASCKARGSIVDCDRQAVQEDVPITGSPLRLVYRSDRAPGAVGDNQVRVQVTGGVVPPGLQGITLRVDIAGKSYFRAWVKHDPGDMTTLPDIGPDIAETIEWDGEDAFGRPVNGRPNATISLVYVYPFVYYEAQDALESSWGQFPQDTQFPFNGRAACGDIYNTGKDYRLVCGVPLEARRVTPLGSSRPVSDALGGWSVSAHHTYDPLGLQLARGDGETVSTSAAGEALQVVGGGGDDAFPAAEGGDARDADLRQVEVIDAASDGTIWFAASGIVNSKLVYKLRRIDPDGTVHTVGGDDTRADPQCDGRDPKTSSLGVVRALAAGPDGSVYLAMIRPNDFSQGVICQVVDGHLNRVAGVYDGPAGTGDGGPALDARVSELHDVIVGPDGLVYFSEDATVKNNLRARVRRIDADGTVRTYAGGGTDAGPGEDLGAGEPALEHALTRPWHLGFGPDGTLYIPQPTKHLVDKVSPAGVLTRFAGDGSMADIGYGQLAVQAPIGDPYAVDVGPDGTAHILVENGGFPADHVILVGSEGRVEPLIGRQCLGPGTPGGPPKDGQPAARRCPTSTREVNVLPDGRTLMTFGFTHIISTRPALPGFGDTQKFVPSSDGQAIFEFDSQGHHLRTRDTLTGAVLWSFGYDAAWRLVRITDRDGLDTTITRAGDGTPSAIHAPGGQTTDLEVDGDGRLSAVESPAGGRTEMTYGAGGLLETFAPPATATTTLAYDGAGRLKSEAGPGGTATLDRAADGEQVTTTLESAAGYVSTLKREFTAEGAYKRTATSATGAETALEVRADGLATLTEPDGTETTMQLGPDPRFGMRSPYAARTVTELPSALKRQDDVTRTATLSDPDDPLSLTAFQEVVTGVGGGSNERYEPGTRTFVTTERHSTTRAVVDDRDRLESLTGDTGLDALAVTRDARGRPTAFAAGAEALTVEWDAGDRPVHYEDAAGRALDVGYDADDRPTTAGGSSFGYDAAGRLATLDGHGLIFDGRGFLASFTPPGGAPTTYDHDPDGRLEAVHLPGGADVVQHFDSGGRLASVDDPDGTTDVDYTDDTERATSLSRVLTAGATAGLTRTFDGPLVISAEQTGAAPGTMEYTYDAGFRPIQVKLTSGADTVTTGRGYDGTGVLTTEGPYTLTRNGPYGQPTKIGDGTIAVEYAYDSLGRPTGRSLTKGATTLASVSWTHDLGGAVATRTIGGTTDTYAYDTRGRLTLVTRDGLPVEEYAYDARENRTSRRVAPAAAQAQTYDGQDRLATLGATSHTFDAAGFQTARGGDSFAYTRLGELRSATVGGTTVTYGYDALGRRVSRTQGADTTRYLYGDPENAGRVSAVRAPDGTLDVLRYDRSGLLHAIDRGATRLHVLTDQVGSPLVVTDAAGTVLKSVRYDAFGGVVSDSAPGVALPLGFAGGLPDPVTGLVRFGARDYDPATGRFTARDPVLFGGGQTSLYAYAANDPIGLADPSGLGDGNAIVNFGRDKAVEWVNKKASENKSGTNAEKVVSETLGKVAENAAKGKDFNELKNQAAEGAAEQLGAHQEVRRLNEQAVKNAEGAQEQSNIVKRLWEKACGALSGDTGGSGGGSGGGTRKRSFDGGSSPGDSSGGGGSQPRPGSGPPPQTSGTSPVPRPKPLPHFNPSAGY